MSLNRIKIGRNTKERTEYKMKIKVVNGRPVRSGPYLSSKDIKEAKKKRYYVQLDKDSGLPFISCTFYLNTKAEGFNTFTEAYIYWQNLIESMYPNTLIVEVDASTMWIPELKHNIISYSFRIIRRGKIVRNVTCAYGSIPHEYHEIGTFGVAEIIAATYALKELSEFEDYSNVLIRYDNRFIKRVANGERVPVREENEEYIKEYVRTYNKLKQHKNVIFHHVFSHTGDKAHDTVDSQARSHNNIIKQTLCQAV